NWMRSGMKQETLVVALRNVLGLCAAIYFALGLYFFFGVDGGQHGDLWWRWLEKEYVFSGIDPLGANASARAGLLHLPPMVSIAGYAPWSYIYAVLFAPGSSYQWTPLAFLAWNAAAVAYLVWFGYRQAHAINHKSAEAQLGAVAAIAFLAAFFVLRQ